MITGFEKDLGSDTLFRVEGYYKTFDDLIVGRLEPEAERLARVARYDFPADLQANVPSEAQITSTPVNGGRGTAYGVDAYLVRSNLTSRLAGWLSYAWGRADRDTYGLRFPFEYDRRHTFNAVGRYRIGRGWSVAATATCTCLWVSTPTITVCALGWVVILLITDGLLAGSGAGWPGWADRTVTGRFRQAPIGSRPIRTAGCRRCADGR